MILLLLAAGAWSELYASRRSSSRRLSMDIVPQPWLHSWCIRDRHASGSDRSRSVAHADGD
ncbi:MAG: hypothetical protein MZV64_23565 [Ignavibacteriales bacterium]|nr:hypothetical protein [Ignavibacteriales bacterium]